MICLPSYRYLGADETDNGIQDQRFIGAGDGIGARLTGLLVEPVVGLGRQGGPLPCLEIHDIATDRSARETLTRLPRLLQQRERNAERLVGLLCARDGLKD